MVNKNEIKKSIIVSTAVLCAGTMLAMSPAQTVSAAVASPTGIAAVVEQAPSASIEVPVQWSTAEVYKNARYGETWGGPVLIPVEANSPTKDLGHVVKWEWLNDMNYVFSAEHVVTDNGTVLDYQWLTPIVMTQCGTTDTYVSYTDDNEPIRKHFAVQSLGFPESEQDTVQSNMAKWITKFQNNPIYSDVGVDFLDLQEDDVTVRFTFNVTFVNTVYNTVQKGYVSYVQNKVTKEVYRVDYSEHEDFYDATRALTVVFSCIPTQK